MKSQLKTLFAIGSFLWLTGGAYGQTEIKFWLNSSLAANEKNAYQKAAEEFGQKNPKLKVNVEVVPGSETDVAKLMTAVRSGGVRMSPSSIALPLRNARRPACWST